jgi:hypothetical protein
MSCEPHTIPDNGYDRGERELVVLVREFLQLLAKLLAECGGLAKPLLTKLLAETGGLARLLTMLLAERGELAVELLMGECGGLALELLLAECSGLALVLLTNCKGSCSGVRQIASSAGDDSGRLPNATASSKLRAT